MNVQCNHVTCASDRCTMPPDRIEAQPRCVTCGEGKRNPIHHYGENAHAFVAAPQPEDYDTAYVRATGGVPFDHWGRGCHDDCEIPEHKE